MRTQATWLLLSSLALVARAVPHPSEVFARYDTTIASVPKNDPNPAKRAAGVAARKDGFVYGPSLIGEAAFFLNGTLGNARTKADMDLWAIDRAEIDSRIAKDVAAIQQVIQANGGLKTLDDYAKVLYEGQWKNSNPRGTAPGIMSNYTQDLLFSMERLSQNPYSLKLIKPTDNLPFQLDDQTSQKISGATLKQLKASSSLFYVDYTYQTHYPKSELTPKRYGAACSAYFYIHPKSKDFLPLAIKTNTGKDLIYTPLDSANDWLLAKIMFNVNDLFDAQMRHLVITHDVSEAVHEAALRTLSSNHPIMVILERLMLQGYSSRIVGEQLCFNPNGHWDQLMFVNNIGCRDYVTETWPVTGRYQAGYLHVDLKARGLLNDKNQFPFKSFPFFQDASKIHGAYKAFFKSFVDSYYANDAALAADYEVQNWFIEATKGAKVYDFPQVTLPHQLVHKDTLVDVLTHFGFIVSVGHHALNGGDPIGSKATLPFHLPAIFAPVPEKKGVTDLMPFMPSIPQTIHYIGFIASFNRPFYDTSGRTLEAAFSESSMLGKLNQATHKAAATFLKSMQDLSDQIRARGFDKNGLSMNMPFVYRTLDPNYIPFFCAV